MYTTFYPSKEKKMTKWPKKPTPLLCKEMLPRMPGSYRVMYSEMEIIRPNTKLKIAQGKRKNASSRNLIIRGCRKDCPGKGEEREMGMGMNIIRRKEREKENA
jgi:hypothetical protein